MPLAVAVFAALAERRPVSAGAYRIDATVGDGFADVDDDDALFG
jgi:hypothetical protein